MAKPREIAPKLFNGDSRVRTWNRLPEPIKEALFHIAASENRSVSWVLEEVVVDYFGLRRPRYKKRKNGHA